MEKLTISAFKTMVNTALENISKRSEEFSKLDAVCGDGDHGTAIVAALTAIVKAGEAGTEFKATLTDMAFGAMQESCGSTSTLIGAFFLGMSDAVEGEDIDSAQMKSMFAAGLANVQKQTKAKVGDKTMMDSLVPAVETIQATEGSISDILSKGAQSAQKGAESTENLKANFGRARNLGERSVGSIDPGAASWACMFESFAQAYN